jgi:large subunit ribosomal protein L21
MKQCFEMALDFSKKFCNTGKVVIIYCLKKMLAVIQTGGKQYKVKEDDELLIEKIAGEEKSLVVFDKVLMIGDEKDVKIGDPFLKSTKVEAEILEQTRAKKVVTVKHKAKKRNLKKAGHRQWMTKVKIGKIKV